MFSAKLFNQITIVVAIIFFLSATISTITDMQKEKNISTQFTQLLQEVNMFNTEHSNSTTQPPIGNPDNGNTVVFQNGKEAIVTAFANYKNANSYYSEAYGRLNFSALNFPFEVDLWIKNIQFEDGDFIQEVIAKEVGSLFGGKKGAMIAYYKQSENLIYRNFTWDVGKVQNKWVPYYTDYWRTQSLAEFTEEFGAEPGAPIYDITNRTTVEELYYQDVKGVNYVTAEYHIQYKLNPTLSTKLYMGFISYVLNIVESDFVKSLSFKELSVSAIVDNQGNLNMTKYKEKFGFTIYVRQWGGVIISATCYSDMTYMYTSFNTPISYQKPNVN